MAGVQLDGGQDGVTAGGGGDSGGSSSVGDGGGGESGGSSGGSKFVGGRCCQTFPQLLTLLQLMLFMLF